MPARSPGPIALVVLAAVTAGAGPAKQSWDSEVKPVVRVQVLPNAALVEVDGQARGSGLVTLDVTDPKRTFRVRASAEGFETEEAVVEGGKVVNRHFFLALRPVGFGSSGRIDPGDATRMAQAAEVLWRAGRIDDAVEYAEQSLLAGRNPLANRVLGDVWRRRGDRDKATRYYAAYLSLAESPPDAAEIRAYLSQPRPGDITVPTR
jgi:tetratricopeptide (TPR) repeat protein